MALEHCLLKGQENCAYSLLIPPAHDMFSYRGGYLLKCVSGYKNCAYTYAFCFHLVTFENIIDTDGSFMQKVLACFPIFRLIS